MKKRIKENTMRQKESSLKAYKVDGPPVAVSHQAFSRFKPFHVRRSSISDHKTFGQ